MKLLTFHKILVSAALLLALVLVWWGVANRGQPGGWAVLALGAGVIVPAALYLRKLFTNPPIK